MEGVPDHLLPHYFLASFPAVPRRFYQNDLLDGSSDEDEISLIENGFFHKARTPLPFIIRQKTPDVSRIIKSDLYLETKQASGNLNDSIEKNICLASMIQKQTLGLGFTTGEKCRINNHFLPNKKHQFVRYCCKAYCGTFSEDGNYFLCTNQDRLLRLYHVQHGKLKPFKKIPARDISSSILDTAFSPDGKYIAYSSWSESIYVCSMYGDPNIQDALSISPGERRFCVFSLVFSNDGNEIIGSGSDGHLSIYDVETHQRTLRIQAHSKDANSVKFADKTSQILFSGGDDGLCKVWDKRIIHESDSEPVGAFAGHRDGITYIDTRGDGRHLITNSKDQTIKLWDMRVFSDRNAQKKTLKAAENQNWNYRWQQVPLRLHDAISLLEGDTSIMTYRGHAVLQTLIRCRFSPLANTGQRYIYTGCASGNVIIYDVLTGKKVKSLRSNTGCIRDVSWHPHYQQIVSTSWEGAIISWNHSSNIHLLPDFNVEIDLD